MSRWISKYPAYEFIADSGFADVSKDSYGRTIGINRRSPLTLKFNQERMLPAYERLYAVNHWLRGPRRANGAIDAFGAAPSMYGGEPIVDGNNRMVGVTEGLRPDERFSIFDTDTLSGEERETAEHMLRTHDLNGRDYIEILPEAVPPPWPTYDQFTAARKIADVVRQLGLDPTKVMHYEQATKNRDDVLVALAELQNEQLAEAAIQGALTVETP